MHKPPIIRGLTIQNLLSFGEQPITIALRPLNLLIGPNGSGKSNLIEVLRLLQNTPKELASAISNGGPIEEWLWKGATKVPTASIEAIVSHPSDPMNLRYRLAFSKAGFRFGITDELLADFELTDESVENERPWPGRRVPAIYFEFANGRPMLRYEGEMRELRAEDLNPQLSILAQRKDPEHYRVITYIADVFGRIKLYRDWEFGTISNIREPCDASLPNEYLEEDGSNLGVVLDRLLAQPRSKSQILGSLRTFYENATDLRTNIEGGKVQTRLEEEHLNSTVPLVRMSDGTVRWLALLTILLNNPSPPPLVCIEEPELGLHPEMIPELAKMLIDASDRMQLIITTHSERLVEAFSERPEDVIVCEKEGGSSSLRRLNARELSSWLKEYSLGKLWAKGQLGGTRW